MKYHIKFQRNHSSGGECRINLEEKELMELYVSRFLNQENIIINGTVLRSQDIYRVKITRSEANIDNEIIKIKDEDLAMYSRPKSSAKWRAIDLFFDVTNEFLSRVPIEKDQIKELKISQKSDYINVSRIDELRVIKSDCYDLSKLIRICEEINNGWQSHNYFSVIALVRTILHHIAPIFGFKNFEEVANSYNGGKSFKKSMQHLLNSSKNIADNHLHSQAQRNEALPNDTQVNYQNDIDFLLSEIIKLTKS